MAQPLRESYGLEIADWVAGAVAEVLPGLDRAAFREQCAPGFEDLALMARAQRIADVLADHLPADPRRSIPLVTAAMGEPAEGLTGIEPFRYQPFGAFVAAHGLDTFEESMVALNQLTRCFTAEFALRAFLIHHEQRTLQRLTAWADDPDPRVRRLVSEGTRPRLPWARRLPSFVADPRPVLDLLELLRDDPSATVRRSVANNLNDIGKDNPQDLLDTAQRWWADGDPTRRRLVRHALRGLAKQADPRALSIVGHEAADDLSVVGCSVGPDPVPIGGSVRIDVEVRDIRASGEPRSVRTDVVVHFVKASGASSAKVFRAGVRSLGPGDVGRFTTTVSVAQHTTRTHYPGRHVVQAQVNGTRSALGSFVLLPADPGSGAQPGQSPPAR